MLNCITALTQNTGLNNVYTPLPLVAHFIFCLVATALYLTQFCRQRSWHYMLMMIAVDMTFLTQTPLCSNHKGIFVLGILEIVVLAAALALYIPFSKKQKALLAESQAEAEAEKKVDEMRRENAEKVEEQQNDPVENAFDKDGDDI